MMADTYIIIRHRYGAHSFKLPCRLQQCMVSRGGGEDADDTATDDDDGYSLDDAKFIKTNDEIQADILLTNTCAICENAENKVWNHLRELRSHDCNYPLSALEDRTMSLKYDLMKMTTKEKRKHLAKQNAQQNKNSKKLLSGCWGAWRNG